MRAQSGEASRQSWRLLVLSCSARKRAADGDLPAIERYDGPAFRLLRRFRRMSTLPASGVQVRAFVLSAQFGLIDEAAPVPWYDRTMTRQRGLELMPAVTGAIRAVMDVAPPSEALVYAGRQYLGVLVDAIAILDRCTRLVVAAGPPGSRLALLHDWLHGRAPNAQVPRLTARRPHLRGAEIVCTGRELLSAAEQALTGGDVGFALAAATRYHAWFIDIGGHRVAPKWLASLASGRPVSAFSTTDARRLLTQLGVRVQRV